jgi:hypothetical protein
LILDDKFIDRQRGIGPDNQTGLVDEEKLRLADSPRGDEVAHVNGRGDGQYALPGLAARFSLLDYSNSFPNLGSGTTSDERCYARQNNRGYTPGTHLISLLRRIDAPSRNSIQ